MNYWDSFGFEWLRWPTTQLDGPGRHESERVFAVKTGLMPDDVKGKRVLDVGCGAGRFLEVAYRWGARVAVGIDPSAATYAASENLRGRDNVAVYKVDIHDLKLGRHSGYGLGRRFDIVYSLGVLHHTPDPKASLLACARLVRSGGLLCVWVYSRDEGRWAPIADLYRKLTVRLPWWLLRILCLFAIPWGLVHEIPVIGPYLWAPFPCSTHPRWRWRWLDTFDMYSPRYRSRHTEAEVKSWFIEAGFVDIEALGFPVSVRGRRP